MFKPGTLYHRLIDRTEHARRCGAQSSIPTQQGFVPDGGVRFLVRLASSLQRKDEEKRKAQQQAAASPENANPFLPYDEDLFVADVSDTHVALLNKFNVVEHHLLVVTRQFEDQQSALSSLDFEAVWRCMAEFESLAFYNAGAISGASQGHKHLQLVPLPLASSGPPVPIEPALPATDRTECIELSPRLPFSHAFARLDPSWLVSPEEAAIRTHSLYRAMLSTLGLSGDGNCETGGATGPYNLLATRNWMLLVPRAGELFESVPINALGFAGALLVRSHHELATLKARGPMTALRQVAFRPRALR